MQPEVYPVHGQFAISRSNHLGAARGARPSMAGLAPVAGQHTPVTVRNLPRLSGEIQPLVPLGEALVGISLKALVIFADLDFDP